MLLRLAFAGFRHGHIYDFLKIAQSRSDVIVAGAAEDNAAAAAAAKKNNVELTHSSIDALFSDATSFDAVAIGDYYTRRGDIAIRALELGKHVIIDKPVCTRINELKRIRELSLKKRLVVSCQLSLRDRPQFRTLKRLVAEQAIGRVQTVNFMGQHPLAYGSRDAWYFEDGKHGGTITDIGIHGIDAVQWLLGIPFGDVVAARVWNTRLPQCPSFNVGAQMLLSLADGAGILGDVSYLSPNSQGYSVPQYWRFTLHGEKGILETNIAAKGVQIWRDGKKEGETVALDEARPDGYFLDFLNEIAGRKDLCDLTTEQVLESSRVTLLTQNAADEGLSHIKIN